MVPGAAEPIPRNNELLRVTSRRMGVPLASLTMIAWATARVSALTTERRPATWTGQVGELPHHSMTPHNHWHKRLRQLQHQLQRQHQHQHQLLHQLLLLGQC